MSVFNHTSTLTSLGFLLALTACSAPSGQFPSLERRPFETQAPPTETLTPAPAAPTALPAALAVKASALAARHKAANASFAESLATMRGTAANAAGAAPGSESWVNAHLQLSRVDKARADSVAALGELDALIAEQIDGDSAYVTLLTGIQQNIAVEVAAQRAEIDRMSRQIGE